MIPKPASYEGLKRHKPTHAGKTDFHIETVDDLVAIANSFLFLKVIFIATRGASIRWLRWLVPSGRRKTSRKRQEFLQSRDLPKDKDRSDQGSQQARPWQPVIRPTALTY